MSHTPNEHSERKGQSEPAPTTAICGMDGMWTQNTFRSVSCVTTVVTYGCTLHTTCIYYLTSALATNLQLSVT
jgi:hypothetical protein